MPKRGCHIFLSEGIVPSDGKVKLPRALVTVESIQRAK